MAIQAPETKTDKSIFYPASDGQSMAESDETGKLMIDSIDALKHYFHDRPDVYVSGNLLIYYKEGDPRRRIAPDVFVALGVPGQDRKIYQTWVEGKMPDFVLEICSDTTWRKDLGLKNSLYYTLGVQEYFLFDASGGRLDLPVLGFRRQNMGFAEVEPDEQGFVESQTLGLRLREEDSLLRFYDASGQLLLTSEERALLARQAVETAQKQIEAALLRAIEAEKRIAELEARLLAQAKG